MEIGRERGMRRGGRGVGDVKLRGKGTGRRREREGEK
jgi:hypothetical protein